MDSCKSTLFNHQLPMYLSYPTIPCRIRQSYGFLHIYVHSMQLNPCIHPDFYPTVPCRMRWTILWNPIYVHSMQPNPVYALSYSPMYCRMRWTLLWTPIYVHSIQPNPTVLYRMRWTPMDSYLRMSTLHNPILCVRPILQSHVG